MAPARGQYVRSKLIGIWELLEYCTYLSDDESNKFNPVGKSHTEIIIYNEDGYISAQVQVPGQQSFGEDQGSGTESDWAEVGRRFSAYTGEFFLDEKATTEVAQC